MATFEWVEAVEFARTHWQSGALPLARAVSELEYIVEAAEAAGDSEAGALRRTWSELEIINALDLADDLAAVPAEIDELLAAFAAAVTRATGGQA